MYNNRIVECLSKVHGWKNHYNNEVPELSEEMRESESGEFYNDMHPAMKLDLIKATIPRDRNLEDHLKEIQESSFIEVISDISEQKLLYKNTKEVLTNDVIYNSKGFIGDTIINEGRFVGVRFNVILSIGLKATINRIGLQFNSDQDMDLYLFHSNKEKFIKKIKYKSTNQVNNFHWIESKLDLVADDYDLSGGEFYLGYYQDDVQGLAVNYTKLDWKKGYCGGCDGGINQARYSGITKAVKLQGFHVPAAGLNIDHDVKFDQSQVMENDKRTWGFNFNISVKCDLTNFWCDNRLILRKAIGLKVVYRVLKEILYSQQINHVEEQMKMMIIRDLEGDKDTNYVNIPRQYERAIKVINLSSSGVNSICIPCLNKPKSRTTTM